MIAAYAVVLALPVTILVVVVHAIISIRREDNEHGER